MNSLIVCVPCGVTLEEICDQLVGSGMDADFRDGRISVSRGGSRAWVEPDLDGELEREYESDERALIEGIIGKWVGFTIDYRTLGVADAVVAVMSERWACVIDDEEGFLGLAREYFER